MADENTLIKLLQAILQAELGKREITPQVIAEKLDSLLQAAPQFGIDPQGIDRQATIDEMVRRFSLWIGSDTMLIGDTGHEAWLDSSRKKGWRYWPRYREWLDAKLSVAVIDAVDRSTDTVLGLLEDPLRQGAWDRRGLVVGKRPVGKDRPLHRPRVEGSRCWLQDRDRPRRSTQQPEISDADAPR